MKKKITTLILMITAICSSKAMARETAWTTANLNCRETGNIGANIITTFPKGTKLETIGYNNGWVQVHDGKIQGWCHQNYLSFTEEKPVETVTPKIQNSGNMEYLGVFKLTGYCPCRKCSSSWSAKTASGVTAKAGVTVAASKNLPFGTKLYIEDVGYRIVQDRGGAIKGNKLDVFVNTHSECYSPNINKNAKVYIVR